MDITQELEFHGIHTVEVDGVKYLDLENAKALLDLYSESSLKTARIEAHGDRMVEALGVQSTVLSIFSKLVNKLEKRYGSKKAARKLFDDAYKKIEKVSDHVDTLKNAPPIA